MKKKFLFFDMDRTLISSETRTIPQSAIDGINQAMANGHHCFLCTGRSFTMAREYDDLLHIPGVVFANGAGIAYEDQILETHSIHPSAVQKVQEICEHLHGGYQFFSEGTIYQNPITRARFQRFFRNGEQYQTPEEMFEKRGLKTIEEYHDQPVQKIDINFVDELAADIFFSRMPNNLELVFAGGYFAGLGRTGGEITAAGITKGFGVKRVVELFDGDMFDTYGFGDSDNDLAMLETCHTGIAMGNASENVKRNADYVTNDYDHDGIYNALKHFELI